MANLSLEKCNWGWWEPRRDMCIENPTHWFCSASEPARVRSVCKRHVANYIMGWNEISKEEAIMRFALE